MFMNALVSSMPSSRGNIIFTMAVDDIASRVDSCSKKSVEQFAITHQLLYSKKTAIPAPKH